ncbi:hypothetical protein MYO4S_00178 [Serratia phage 4S]|nr:hypothetical protein MYO4S_00178 [Serratia phage 4S]
MDQVKAYTLHEQGKDFDEIAKILDVSAKEAAALFVQASIARQKHLTKEPVVYRKRLIVKKKPQARRKGNPNRKPVKSIMSKEQLSDFIQAALDKGWSTK